MQTKAGLGASLAIACGLLLASCDGGGGGDDAAAGSDAGSATDASARPDAALAPDGSVERDGGLELDGGAVCDPTPGTATLDGYCDLFELAIFTSSGVAPEARLHGRVTPDGTPTCAVIDEVEVQEGGVAIATLSGGGAPFSIGAQHALLARGPAVSGMTSRCASDDRRFGGFGFIVRGRADGGTFEARCADAEGGYRWPPALRVTCHDNVERQPSSASATVTLAAGTAYTSLDVTVPHGPGGAVLGVDGTVHVIPHAYSGFGAPPVPPPFDSTGWSATISESSTPWAGTYSGVHLSREGAAFDSELCRAPSTEPPGPDYVPPPVFLVRVSGTSERGAYSTEAYVDSCMTLSM